MKRWLLVMGRVGTVMVAAGLALLLVSLIPPARTSSFSSGNQIAPETFQLFGPALPPFATNITFYSQFFSTLTPQQELRVELTCNGTLEAYLLKTSTQSFMDNFEAGHNTSALKGYLQTNPDTVVWQGEIAFEGTVDYIPTEVINATLILSNPSSDSIRVDFEGGILSLLGPSGKVQALAFFAIPIGFVLASPWLLNMRKSKTE